MFSRGYNIISGEKTEQRIRSVSSQVQPSSFTVGKQRLLGKAKDYNNYRYHYQENGKVNQKESLKNVELPPLRMLNSVSTDYNIITHSDQCPTSQLHSHALFQHIKNVNRKHILTEMINKGRLLSPNYHLDYADRFNNGEFLRRKGICDDICRVQNGYKCKYFRKFK